MSNGSEQTSFFSKNKKPIGIGFLVIVIVTVCVVVPVVLVTTNSSKKDDKEEIIEEKPPAKKPFDLDKISIQDRNRIDCFLEAESRFENLTRFQCEEVRSCIYKPSEYERVPDCYFDRESLGYELEYTVLQSDNMEIHYLKRSGLVNAPYADAIERLVLTVEYLERNVLHIKIEDRDDASRYQVPYKLKEFRKIDDKRKSKVRFEPQIDDKTRLLSFKVIRNEDDTVLFDTSMGAFVYEDQFLQIATRLSSPYVYGFGENNHESLLHDLNFRSWGMFARDNAPGSGVSLFLTWGFIFKIFSIFNSVN
jgi:hypothetical protein